MAKRKPAKKWKPPVDDVGNVWSFVQTNYGKQPEARQRAIYNRLKQQGAEFGSDPTGQRSGMIRLTPDMVNRLPDGWGAEGVQNVGRGLPQYDQTKFEIGQNSAGRYFLRPITEFTGLGPAQVAAIREMDARSTAQQSVIKGAYNAAADSSAKDAQDLATRLASIPGANAMTNAPSSAGAAAGAGTDQRLQDQARSDQTLAATRAAAEAALRAPVIRQMGISGADAYAVQAQQARAQALSNFSSSNAQAQAAADNLNARLRGQDLSLIGNQLRTGAQVTMNNADNARAIATNTADNSTRTNIANANIAQRERASVRQMQVRLAGIDAQIKIANQRNDTARATALARLKQQEMARYGRSLQSNLRLVPDTDADGNPIPVPQQRSQLVQMLVSQGIPRADAIRMSRGAIK